MPTPRQGKNRNWLRETGGITAIEYGLIAAGISLAIMAAVLVLGGSLHDIFSFFDSKMTSVLTRL